MKHELKKKIYVDPGSQGRPSWYPVPPEDKDILFFIQRNQNQDAIVYRVNRTSEGLINDHLPMDAYWIRFTEGGIRRELNDLQNRLAYGYDIDKISPDLYRFQFVSYKDLTFYINRSENGKDFKVVYQYDDRTIVLKNIYVYAVEFGVFPDVKYIELYGEDVRTNLADYKMITIEK